MNPHKFKDYILSKDSQITVDETSYSLCVKCNVVAYKTIGDAMKSLQRKYVGIIVNVITEDNFITTHDGKGQTVATGCLYSDEEYLVKGIIE